MASIGQHGATLRMIRYLSDDEHSPTNRVNEVFEMKIRSSEQTEPSSDDALLSLDEAARLLSCTVGAIRKWLAQGRLQRVKLGRLTRVRRHEVLQIVAKGLPPRQ